jgi:purine-binding chemotaxis protein CheW
VTALASPPTRLADSQTGVGNQYLTFCLGDEEYGLEILRVQEIKGYSKITPLPNTPPEVKGVMNLRGAVVPIIDLRTKLGLPVTEYDRFTVIIIANVGNRIVGVVVDAVSDVLDVTTDDIVPTPEFGGGTDTSYLSGMARIGERLVTLLNLDHLVGTKELATLG